MIKELSRWDDAEVIKNIQGCVSKADEQTAEFMALNRVCPLGL